VLPDGWCRKDLLGIGRFRDYAVQNAESWYKYANGPRARDAGNGSIYLITGCDKSKSWGVASFSDVSASFDLTFIPAAAEGGNTNHTSTWDYAGYASTNSGPPIEDFDHHGVRPQNQSTFIRGFKISLSQGLWSTLWNRGAIVSPILDAKPNDLLSTATFIPFRSRNSWFRGFFSNVSRGSQQNEQAGEEPGSDETGTSVPDGDVIVTSGFLPPPYVSTLPMTTNLTRI
jgi:hypothetical protein